MKFSYYFYFFLLLKNFYLISAEAELGANGDKDNSIIFYIAVSIVSSVLIKGLEEFYRISPLYEYLKEKKIESQINLSLEVDKNIIYESAKFLGYSSMLSIFEAKIKKWKSGNVFPMESIFVYGPPGNGKSRFIQELSNKSNMPRIHLNKIFSLNIEDSSFEVILKTAFKLIKKKHGKALVIIDDADCQLPTRQSQFGITLREKNILSVLLELFGDEEYKKTLNGFVFCVITNHKDSIDKALVRAKRLGDIQLFYPNPLVVDILTIFESKSILYDSYKKYLVGVAHQMHQAQKNVADVLQYISELECENNNLISNQHDEEKDIERKKIIDMLNQRFGLLGKEKKDI